MFLDHHISMISEGSFGTENWNNGYRKFSFAITDFFFFFLHLLNEKLFYIVKYFTILLFLLYFLSNKCILGAHNRFLKLLLRNFEQ